MSVAKSKPKEEKNIQKEEDTQKKKPKKKRAQERAKEISLSSTGDTKTLPDHIIETSISIPFINILRRFKINKLLQELIIFFTLVYFPAFIL